MSKIIIITGSSKGIGKYLTEYYLNNGNTVFGCSRGEATLVHNNYKHLPNGMYFQGGKKFIKIGK